MRPNEECRTLQWCTRRAELLYMWERRWSRSRILIRVSSRRAGVELAHRYWQWAASKVSRELSSVRMERWLLATEGRRTIGIGKCRNAIIKSRRGSVASSTDASALSARHSNLYDYCHGASTLLPVLGAPQNLNYSILAPISCSSKDLPASSEDPQTDHLPHPSK